MRVATAVILAGLMLFSVAILSAQPNPNRERARVHYRVGLENLRAEAWEKAAKSFKQAIDVDSAFDLAYFGLGRADMGMKKYTDAVAAFSKCRDLLRGQAGRQFSSAQEAQRYRRQRMDEIDETIRQYQAGRQTVQAQTAVRQLSEVKMQLREAIERGTNMTIESTVPAWVSLALGSAYFRSGKLLDAEREYKAAIATDPKAGEAHSNLAVVYLETERFADAERSIAAAEKAGFRVNPQLKQDIKDRKKGA
jgi:tetratricopeptide (TPR) repeat protein